MNGLTRLARGFEVGEAEHVLGRAQQRVGVVGLRVGLPWRELAGHTSSVLTLRARRRGTGGRRLVGAGSSWSKVTISSPSFLKAGAARIFGAHSARKASAAAGPPLFPSGHSLVEPELQRAGER